MRREYASRRRDNHWQGADLVMEVMSPDDPKRDSEIKKREYARSLRKFNPVSFPAIPVDQAFLPHQDQSPASQPAATPVARPKSSAVEGGLSGCSVNPTGGQYG